jgi:hypothetical protein
MAKSITTKDIFEELKRRGVIDIKQNSKIISEFNDINTTTLSSNEKVMFNGLLTLKPLGARNYSGKVNGKPYTKTIKNYVKVSKLSALKNL